eukprot:SAG11_NODE_3747_length_2252_cov_20.257780_2_plen_79_part_00
MDTEVQPRACIEKPVVQPPLRGKLDNGSIGQKCYSLWQNSYMHVNIVKIIKSTDKNLKGYYNLYRFILNQVDRTTWIS